MGMSTRVMLPVGEKRAKREGPRGEVRRFERKDIEEASESLAFFFPLLSFCPHGFRFPSHGTPPLRNFVRLSALTAAARHTLAVPRERGAREKAESTLKAERHDTSTQSRARALPPKNNLFLSLPLSPSLAIATLPIDNAAGAVVAASGFFEAPPASTTATTSFASGLFGGAGLGFLEVGVRR